LTTTNRLPQYNVYQEFRTYNEDINKLYQDVINESSELLSKLILLQRDLTKQNMALPKLSPPQIEKKDSDFFWTQLENNFQTFLPYCEQTIDKWNRKTQQASGQMALSDKKFKILNQSVVTQIQWLMKSPQDLIRKTQLKRLDYTILGKRKRSSADRQLDIPEEEDELATIEGKKEEYDSEILDDIDFYQGLLREIIQSGLEYNSTLENPELLAKAQMLKKRNKKKVDHRITKDKKIRYIVHPKLVNFVAPVVDHDESFLVDELICGLFGQRPTPAPSKSLL